MAFTHMKRIAISFVFAEVVTKTVKILGVFFTYEAGKQSGNLD